MFDQFDTNDLGVLVDSDHHMDRFAGIPGGPHKIRSNESPTDLATIL